MLTRRRRSCLFGGFLIATAVTVASVAPVAAANQQQSISPITHITTSDVPASPVQASFDSVAKDSPTGHDVAGRFQTFYDQSGGLPVFGYALSGPVYENNVFVQYFERQRFEYHPDKAGTPYEVELGRLGFDTAQEKGLLSTAPFQPQPAPSGDNANCSFVAPDRPLAL